MSFEQCLARGKIKEFSQGKALVQKELQTAGKDLSDGKEGLSAKNINGQLSRVIMSCFTRRGHFFTRKITKRKITTV